MPLIFRNLRRVAIKLGLVQGPDNLFGSLRYFCISGKQFIENFQVLGGLMPLAANILER